MRKVQIVFGLTLICLVALPTVVLADANADKQPPFAGLVTAPVDNAVNMFYDPASGLLTSQSNGAKADASALVLTSFDLRSRGDLLLPAGADAGWAVGPFDSANPAKFFKLDTNGWTEQALGNAVAAGQTGEALMADLTIAGSLGGGGNLVDAPGGGPWLVVVPEPSSILLAAFGLLGLVSLRRK